MGLVSAEARTKLYKAMNARGWKTKEPGIESIVRENRAYPPTSA